MILLTAVPTLQTQELCRTIQLHCMHQSQIPRCGVRSPNTNTSINQATLFAVFVRARLFGWDGNIESIFERPGFLAGASRKVKQAAAQLQSRLRATSDDIETRGFDSEGLAQGIPFVWRNLHPGTAPFLPAI